MSFPPENESKVPEPLKPFQFLNSAYVNNFLVYVRFLLNKYSFPIQSRNYHLSLLINKTKFF